MKNNNSWPPKWVTPVTKKNLNKSRGKEISAFINSMCIQTKDTIAGRSGDLLATAKLGSPLKRRSDVDVTIQVKFDID